MTTREFVDPDRFDSNRKPERQLGFGTGIHFCIGAHAARLEGIVLLQELLARVPEWDVDEAGVERLPSEFQIGDTAVPIDFLHERRYARRAPSSHARGRGAASTFVSAAGGRSRP